MTASEILLRLKSLKRYDASGDVFMEVSYIEDSDGFWAMSADIDELILEIESNEHL